MLKEGLRVSGWRVMDWFFQINVSPAHPQLFLFHAFDLYSSSKMRHAAT